MSAMPPPPASMSPVTTVIAIAKESITPPTFTSPTAFMPADSMAYVVGHHGAVVGVVFRFRLTGSKNRNVISIISRQGEGGPSVIGSIGIRRSSTVRRKPQLHSRRQIEGRDGDNGAGAADEHLCLLPKHRRSPRSR